VLTLPGPRCQVCFCLRRIFKVHDEKRGGHEAIHPAGIVGVLWPGSAGPDAKRSGPASSARLKRACRLRSTPISPRRSLFFRPAAPGRAHRAACGYGSGATAACLSCSRAPMSMSRSSSGRRTGRVRSCSIYGGGFERPSASPNRPGARLWRAWVQFRRGAHARAFVEVQIPSGPARPAQRSGSSLSSWASPTGA
jgi:hypothetical protein